MTVLLLLCYVLGTVWTLEWYIFLSYGLNSSLTLSQAVLLNFVCLPGIIGLSSAKDLLTCINPAGLSESSAYTLWPVEMWLVSERYFFFFSARNLEGGGKCILNIEPIPKPVEGKRINLILNPISAGFGLGLGNTVELKSEDLILRRMFWEGILSVGVFLKQKNFTFTNSLPWSLEKSRTRSSLVSF